MGFLDAWAARRSRPLPAPADRPSRQTDDCTQELEHAIDYDAEEAEGEQEKPDEGIGHERQQCQRPAHDEQNQPDQKLPHIHIYDGPRLGVPGL